MPTGILVWDIEYAIKIHQFHNDIEFKPIFYLM